MPTKKVCPTCKGRGTVPGNCACDAEWRVNDGESKIDDCICEPDMTCPDCKGTGYVIE